MIFAVAAPLKPNYVGFIAHVFIIILELFERQNGQNTGCRCNWYMLNRAAEEV